MSCCLVEFLEQQLIDSLWVVEIDYDAQCQLRVQHTISVNCTVMSCAGDDDGLATLIASFL